MRTEDGYIIQQCLDGDASAFAFLVEKYKKAVYASAYFRVRNFHDAQDITQEVFINAYRNLRNLRRWDNFMGWLYRITANQCKMLMRARARRPDSEFVEDQEQDILDQPSMDFYHENSVYEYIQEALDSLPETYRQVMTLRYFGGMTVKEMSRFLGVSPGTIDRRLREARAQLRERIPAMMSTAYENNELPTTFTFRIVETVKRIRIHPTPRAAGLPWGLSLAAGIIITVMSLSSHLDLINSVAIPSGSLPPSEVEILELGELPVDMLRIPNVSLISGQKGNGKSGKFEFPGLPKALFMAPQAGGDTWTKKADMPTARVGLSTSVVNGKVYAVGGATFGGAVIPTVEEYDPATDTWTKKADMPTARMTFSASAVGGKIYAIGGENQGILPVVEVYDTGSVDEGKNTEVTGKLPTKWGEVKSDQSSIRLNQ